MTRSCLPPVTISPASDSSGRLELFTSAKPVHLGSVVPYAERAMPPNQALHVARFRDHYLSGPQPFVQS